MRLLNKLIVKLLYNLEEDEDCYRITIRTKRKVKLYSLQDYPKFWMQKEYYKKLVVTEILRAKVFRGVHITEVRHYIAEPKTLKLWK